MTQKINILVQFTGWIVVKGSTRGCGRRYKLDCHDAAGQWMSVETSPTSESNFDCPIGSTASNVLRMTLRERGHCRWFADAWDDSTTAKANLAAEFAALQVAAKGEQSNGQ